MSSVCLESSCWLDFTYTRCGKAALNQSLPSALALLANSMKAAGWTVQQLPADAVVVGEYVRVFDGVEKAFPTTFELKGQRKFKMKSDSGLGLTLNGDQAVFQNSEGIWQPPPHSVISMRPLALPMFSEIPLAATGDFDIQYIGTDAVSGEGCDQLLIQPKLDPVLGEDDVLRRSGHLQVCISQKSNLPVEMTFVRLSDSNAEVTSEHTVQFSDYRTVNAIAVPFQLEEFVAGRSFYKFRIDSLQLNVGLPDSDFAIVAVTGAN